MLGTASLGGVLWRRARGRRERADLYFADEVQNAAEIDRGDVLYDTPYRAAQARISVPRLCFVGSKDEIRYGPTWGDVFVSMSDPVVRHRAVSAKVAAQVRDMMVGVVRSGTGTAAAIPAARPRVRRERDRLPRRAQAHPN